MSYYLDLLNKKKLTLTHEQIVSRKALKMPTRTPTINKMRAKMDEIVSRQFSRRDIREELRNV